MHMAPWQSSRIVEHRHQGRASSNTVGRRIEQERKGFVGLGRGLRRVVEREGLAGRTTAA